MAAIWQWSAVDTARAIREGRASAVEVAQAHIARMAAANPALNAVVVDLSAQALKDAAAADAARAAGATLGPLHGVPVTIKINVDVKGQANSNGVVGFKDNIAADDAPVTANLRRAGAVILGLTTTPEFSMRGFTDNPLHGQQEGRFFHGYYDSYCYLPLYVFCGQAMLACVLRPSKIDGARHAAAVIKLLVARLRQAWPATRFIVRADSGFCRRRLLQWCERSGVGYIIGLARNARLHAAVEVAEAALADAYRASGAKQRLIGEFSYAAQSWPRERRVITRLEYGEQGTNPRFVVTNLEGAPEALYDGLYCQRGEAENRIKEAQLDLFGTRASCSRFIANQFRLLLAALAYTLMQRLRALALQGTELERASAATIRVRLLKIGAAILRNTRRVRVMLASHHPLRVLFATAASKLAALGP
jgi:hypothetical protein